MQSHTEINVSHNGKHFFATAERSGTDATRIILVLAELVKRFPKEEGYEITATYWVCKGKIMDVDFLIGNK